MTFIKSYIQLDEAPEILQKAVMKSIETMSKYAESKVLCVTKTISAPYKDKSILCTTYNAYLETVNFLETFRYSECSKTEWTDQEVRKNAMNIGEIMEFVKHSEWLKDDVRRMLKNGGG
ncbi:hypothetical protein [Paenibacillus thermotolerans]|uniref:hypothetical protein n=1 Tax=Paenibacillus thermotolerans TaxID=3027807 RepID=UPI0023680AE5|nr:MULTISPECIES: hypothetical protein [unclassified Paenibacillus]